MISFYVSYLTVIGQISREYKEKTLSLTYPFGDTLRLRAHLFYNPVQLYQRLAVSVGNNIF